MSDQAPLPGTDDKQVIADIDAVIDSMHDRYRELWVEMALEDIDVPDSLQSSFNRTYQQIDSLSKHLQIARLSKMVQQLEMILSKKKTGRKNSESASMDLESQTGASADSGAHSDVSKLSCARSIPGASASAASFPTIPTIPTARPETDSELTDPCSSGKPGKRTAAQAALSDRGENFTPAAVKNCVLGERLDDRRKRRSLSAAQQMQLQAFITFAINYFREKARDATTVTTRPWRHTNSEQLVSFYNESLTRTEKEQGMEFSMPLFRSNSLQLQILQTSGSVSEAMSKLEEKLSASPFASGCAAAAPIKPTRPAAGLGGNGRADGGGAEIPPCAGVPAAAGACRTSAAAARSCCCGAADSTVGRSRGRPPHRGAPLAAMVSRRSLRPGMADPPASGRSLSSRNDLICVSWNRSEIR
jgi:hypothetical protein